MSNIKHYVSKDGRIKYDRDMDRPDANELNKGSVFLTKEEQDVMIPYLHDDNYPERQMRVLDNDNKRNTIISCDYDNSIVVWKNTPDEEVKSNPFTITAIGFNSKGDEIDGDVVKPKNSRSKENTIWDPRRIIDEGDDNTALENTRAKGIYAFENSGDNKFNDFRRFIQVDVYKKPSQTADDLKDLEVTNMQTILDAIDMSDAVLLAWGKGVSWKDIEHGELEEKLTKLASKEGGKKVYWLGQVAGGQPAHSTSSKSDRKLETIDSATVRNIFN